MQASQVDTREDGGQHCIRVTGAGTFANSQAVQAFGLRRLGAGTVCRFELGGCLSLDSTFIGVMAHLAMRGREHNCRVEIVNAPERVRRQITGLGIGSLFTFVVCDEHGGPWVKLEAPSEGGDGGRRDMAQTVIAAHETLGRANPDNVARFKSVIEVLKAEGAKADPPPAN